MGSCLSTKLPPVGPDEYHRLDTETASMKECVRADKANERLYEKRLELVVRCRRHSNVEQPDVPPPPKPANVDRFLVEQARMKLVPCVDQVLAVEKLYAYGLAPKADYEPQNAIAEAASRQAPQVPPAIIMRRVSGYCGPNRNAEGMEVYTIVSDDDLRTLKLQDAVVIDKRNREVHERGLRDAREAHQMAAGKMHTIYDPITAQAPPSMVTRWHEVKAMTVLVPAGRFSDAVASLCAAQKKCGADYLPQNAEAEAKNSGKTVVDIVPSAPPPIYPDLPNDPKSD